MVDRIDLLFYDGSQFLTPVAEKIGQSIDKVNFVATQILAVVFGRFMCICMDSKFTSPVIRHIYELVVGLVLTYFCFGNQIIHVILQSTVVYLVLCIFPIRYARVINFVWAMGYLSFCHIMRVIFNYQSFSLDITGPLMVLTQRLSSIAFSMIDGERLKSNTPLHSPSHIAHALNHFPSVLEFYSYSFNFHSFFVGPFFFMTDYIRFVEGKQDKFLTVKDGTEGYNNEEALKREFDKKRDEIIYAWRPCLRSLCSVTIYGFVMFFVVPHLEYAFIATSDFAGWNYFSKLGYIYLSALAIRFKYFFAWEFARLGNLSAGFGFSGFTKSAQPAYSLTKNFNFRRLFACNSMKVAIDNWNVGTTKWLRIVVYDRLPTKYAMGVTYVISAFWHGFYPGYYLCFASAAFFTFVGRCARRSIRPLFLGKRFLLYFYHLMTHFVGIMALNVSAASFCLYGLRESLIFYKAIYFTPHIFALLLYIACLLLPPQKRTPITEKKDN